MFEELLFWVMSLALHPVPESVLSSSNDEEVEVTKTTVRY